LDNATRASDSAAASGGLASAPAGSGAPGQRARAPRDAEEGEATSPPRAGDEGRPIFAAPAARSNGAQRGGRTPATPAADGDDTRTSFDGIPIPAVWVDAAAEDYKLGYVFALHADAKTGFKAAWEENATDSTQQQPFQAGWIAGRQAAQRSKPAHRASLAGLVTPAVSPAQTFSNRPARRDKQGARLRTAPTRAAH
jgi:hypothetical protein